MSLAAILEQQPQEAKQDAMPLRLVEPQIKEAFGYVNRNTGDIHRDNMPDYYRVVGVEEGAIARARELAGQHAMRHCFNEESIIRALEKSGAAFDIAKIQILAEDYLETAPHPERAGFYMMVPKMQRG